MSTRDDRLDALVLARAATAKAPGSAADLARALASFAPATDDPARWRDAVAASWERLRRAGAIDEEGRAPDGVAAAARRLGAPASVTWPRIVDRIVPALALGVAPGDARAHKRLDDGRAWAAAIVARAHELWRDGAPPSWTQTCDALVWRGLGLDGAPKRTPPEIRAHFLGRLLAGSSGTAERRLRLLAAREVGAPRADLRALREALVRRWLTGQTWTAAAATAGNGLSTFARAVRDAAAHATEGRFGDRKVFIAALWRALRDDPAAGGSSLDAFKQRLVAAHQAGLVVLARADLVGAMDPDQVRQSETAHLEARYHFVERGEP